MTDSYVDKGEGESQTSLTLLERARRQEVGAWERMVCVYTPLVYTWCRKAKLTAADSEDIGQEVFKAVFQNLGSFRRDGVGDSFRGWLYRITENKVRDYRRKHPLSMAAAGGERGLANLLPFAEGASDQGADDSALCSRDEKALLLRRAIQQLEADFQPQTWQAFARVTLNGEAPPDVARDLGMSVNAVYLAKSRVLCRFRAEFAGLVEM